MKHKLSKLALIASNTQQVHSSDVSRLLVQASNELTVSFCDAVLNPVHSTADCLKVFTTSIPVATSADTVYKIKP
jgi:hypothetical protein